MVQSVFTWVDDSDKIAVEEVVLNDSWARRNSGATARDLRIRRSTSPNLSPSETHCRRKVVHACGNLSRGLAGPRGYVDNIGTIEKAGLVDGDSDN
jgi:hypothetical protein